MALVKFGGGVVQMSGSIAGDTFAKNRYGNYCRARTKPVNPNTAKQQTVRASMAFLTDRWSQTVTAVQRTAWNLYGTSVAMKNRLGESVYLTGFNHYIRSNMIRKQCALAIIDAGPVVFEIPEADPTYAITATEAGQTISTTFDNGLDWADEDGAFMVGYQGQPQNAQRNFFAGPWNAYQVVSGVNGAPPASPAVTAVSFAISELQRQWVYSRILRADGRISEAFRANCFCGA